jgi:uncharacterized protein with HEPN domain
MSGLQPEDITYLRHILDAIARIESYVVDVDQARFETTPLIQDAVVRQVQIIGEATKRLSNDLRTSSNAVPWRNIAGMRHKLVHDYMGVDLVAVWLTVREDLTPLRRSIEEVLGDTGAGSNNA